MKRSTVVTVSFPQTFRFEYDDEDCIEKVKAAMRDHAAYLMEGSQSEPSITYCDDSKFMDPYDGRIFADGA